MEHRLYSRAARWLSGTGAAAAAVLVLAACGGTDSGTETDPGADAAAELHSAQLTQFRDATQIPESLEVGAYADLATVQYAEQARATAELDKPECQDAVDGWGQLEEVRRAPASLAAFEWESGSISHMLIRLSSTTADTALEKVPPQECSEYTATHEDGTTATYTVRHLDLDQIGDGSRAFVVEIGQEEGPAYLYNLLYRNGDHLGTTSLLGPEDEEDYEEMLVAFSEAALERQSQVFG